MTDASEEIPPLVRSPELAKMEDLAEKLAAAELLAEDGRSPKLAIIAMNAKGGDVPAKVRNFEKVFDQLVKEEVDRRFARGDLPPTRTPGYLSGPEFLSLAQQAQSEDTPIEEKDRIIADMMRALKSGRVR
jgi:hypothetical protein